MNCSLVCCVDQLNIDGEIHQQRASNDKVIELWTCQAYNAAESNDTLYSLNSIQPIDQLSTK